MILKLVSLLALCLLFVLAPVAVAQGLSFLTYGQTTTATISPQNPVTVFAFAGSVDDVVTVQVLGLAPELTPTVTLLTPNQQVLNGVVIEDSELPQGALTVEHTLPLEGVYTMIVGGQPGDYLILLDGASAGAAALTVPGSADVTLDGTGDRVLTVTNASPDPLAVSVGGTDAAMPFALTVTDASSQILVRFLGATTGMCFVVPGGSGNLTATLSGGSAEAPIDLSVSIANGMCDPSATSPLAPVEVTATVAPIPTLTQPAPPVTTEEVSNVSATPTCTVTTGGSTNIRSGPGTQYAPITALQAGVTLPLVGMSEDGWGVIEISGLQGFISLAVVATNGACDDLPFVFAPSQAGAPVTPTQSSSQPQPSQATSSPTATQLQPTAEQDQPAPPMTPSATAPQAEQLQPPPATTAAATASPTPSDTPTATFTPSYTPTTPPPPPTAPADANYAIQVQLDTTTSITDFVSYPEGDTQDRVSYSVSGMNASVALPGGQARLILAVSCFGTGTANVTFFTNGQTFTCGQTVVDREVTFDSNTGSILIQAVAGENTYVQWVLTGTATRLN